jgi:YVTN family beta-propeller protein
VEFRVLGPIEVVLDDRAAPVGGPKPRALLAILLLNRNSVVSRDRLIECLWGQSAPASAAHSLDDYISRLRKVLGAERLVRRAPGYLLVVHSGELDLDRFEQLVGQGGKELERRGDAELAARTLRQAVELWRGPALADVLYEPFASAESARLEERRLSALEERFEAELALGRSTQLVGELQALLREHPLRERAVGQLMVALYRSGRQTAALDTFRALRLKLAEELGLEPSPRLRELERKILAHDESLTLAVARPWRSAPGVPRLQRRRLLAGAGAAALACVAIALGIVLGIGTTSAPVVRAAAGDQIALVDESSGRPVARGIALPGSPAAIAADRTSLWLAESDAGAVVRVERSTRAIVERIELPGNPSTVAVAGGAVWVGSVPSTKLFRIDPTTDAVVQTVNLGGATVAALAAGPGGLWVADTADGALIELDPGSGAVRRTVTLGLRPTALAIGANAIWAADYDSNSVAEVDLDSGQTLATIHVGNGPAALTVGSGSVWVANELDATVSRIDPTTGDVVATIPVGSGPVALAPTAGSVWVGSQYAQSITRINPTRNVAERPVPVGGGPVTLAAVGGGLWVGTRPLRRHRGGTLRLLSSTQFPIDPALNYHMAPFQSDGLTNDSLVAFAHASGPDGLRLVPDLAVSLPTPSNGGRTWTFRLRAGIRYSDGRPLQAPDFRRTFERLFRLRSPASGFFAGIIGASTCLKAGSTICDLERGVVTDDTARTVTFNLDAPDPNFLFKLTIGGFSMPVPPGTPFHPIGFHPIAGTGPYKIASADAHGIRYVRNPYFHEWSHAAQPNGNPDAITWRFGLSPAQEASEIAAGRADWTADPPPASVLPDLRVHFADLLHTPVSPETDFFQFNTTLPPFNDVRVRQALNFALDRNVIARLYGGSHAATPTCQVLPPALAGYRRYCPYTRNPDPAGAWNGPDLARAQRLVAASHTRGEQITVWGWTDDPTLTPAVTRYTAGVMARLGYHVRVRLVTHTALDHPPASVFRTIQLIPASWTADYPSAYDFMAIWFSCAGGYDHGWFCDPRLDRKIRHADSLQASNPALATESWSKIDRELVDQAGWLPLVNPQQVDFVSARVHNYQHNPVNGIVVDQLWLR